MTTRTIPVSPFDLVIFGGTGDLARRKLLPALFRRDRARQLPPEARIFGAARRQLSTDEYRAYAEEALREFVPEDELEAPCVERFLQRLDYRPVDFNKGTGLDAMGQALNDGPRAIRVFYLAVAPDQFEPACRDLAKAKLVTDGSRVVVEKPFGHDRASAAKLGDAIGAVFCEDCIYRIDHYLGKETVQNLMALRFSNEIFEPLWNAHHIDHVEITVAETIGVEGRGAYYDTVGAMRDMMQNHVMQLLCLTAMEPPVAFEATSVRDEKLKVLRALKPITAADVGAYSVRGQYRRHGGVPGYAEEVGDEAQAETFVALHAEVLNGRWSGVPFYLRTGKRLRARLSEIALVFRPASFHVFAPSAGPAPSNVLRFRLQPNEAVQQQITIKDPGPGGMRLRQAMLDLSFSADLGLGDGGLPDAYERLVLDVVRGDQTLFMRRDEVDAAWRWIDPIIDGWAERGTPMEYYDSGGRGPDGAMKLVHRDGRNWRDIA
ncbi:MAG TPA: glucose-6-phosphate dehydrogenase [Acetobacteraceae bacterium]|nr:glucose-6-phosphate dehydrogenase [Acetobacteraceae bacterium]